MAGGKRGKADTARHREQRAAAFSVRSGTAVRRPLRPAEAAALVEGIDRSKHGLQKYGIRQLCKLELNRTLGEIAPEGGGVEEPAAQLDARARKEIRDNRAGWIGWLGEHGLAERGGLLLGAARSCLLRLDALAHAELERVLGAPHDA